MFQFRKCCGCFVMLGCTANSCSEGHLDAILTMLLVLRSFLCLISAADAGQLKRCHRIVLDFIGETLPQSGFAQPRFIGKINCNLLWSCLEPSFFLQTFGRRPLSSSFSSVIFHILKKVVCKNWSRAFWGVKLRSPHNQKPKRCVAACAYGWLPLLLFFFSVCSRVYYLA